MTSSWHRFSFVAVAGLLAVGFAVATSVAQESGEPQDSTAQPDLPEDSPVDVPGGRNDPLPSELDFNPGGVYRSFEPYLLPGDPREMLRQRRPPSPYYIGVAATTVSDQLRAHVDLPEGVGLVVQEVFDNSPADEGGLEQHDILVRADGKDLKELDDLINVVEDHAGENESQFAIDIIRRNQPETVWVTPAERPEPSLRQPGFGEGLRQLGPRERRMLERLRERGLGEGFGLPGLDLGQMPGNVSVKIERPDDGPAKITIQRDNESWQINSDDPEAVEQLPEELRPMVRRLMQQSANGGEGGGAFEDAFPNAFPNAFPDQLRERIERMEAEMREMQQQLQRQLQEQQQ